jgi:hypothetical protein
MSTIDITPVLKEIFCFLWRVKMSNLYVSAGVAGWLEENFVNSGRYSWSLERSFICCYNGI